MSDELTTAEVAERLGAPERTIRQWCKDGLLEGAQNVVTPRGNYWTIPASALKTFQRPPMGRPPKTQGETQKPATGRKRANGGASTGGKKGGKK